LGYTIGHHWGNDWSFGHGYTWAPHFHPDLLYQSLADFGFATEHFHAVT
jgi:hypothetical protein